MKKKEMEQKINQAFSHIVPDILDSVLSDCDGQEGKVIEMTEKQRGKGWMKWAAGIAAAIMLFAGGAGFGTFYRASQGIAATISLDVNPSIEITVNQKEKVLSVIPRNEEAKKVIGDMDFKGSGLDITVNALVGSMLRNGYINEAANSILVSVDGSDPVKGIQLQEKLAEEIDVLLQTDTFRGAVLSQTISHDAQIQSLAERYGITEGKAQLIQQLAVDSGLYQFEDLVPLSINELNLLTNTNTSRSQTSSSKLSSTGTASAKAYVGEERALAAALTHAQLSRDDISRLEIELDYEHGSMVYDIEFICDGYEYDYDINAATGELLKYEKELDDSYTPPQKPAGNSSADPSSLSYIGEAKAKAAALTHGGISEESIQSYKCKLDMDDGIVYYEIDFDANGYEYDYDIDALTGAVLKYEREQRGSSVGTPSASSGSDSYIGEAKAKSIALSHANAKEKELYDYSCKLDRGNGTVYYEIDFDWNGYEYEYEIDAFSGSVLKYQREQDDDAHYIQNNTNSGSSYIGEAKAKAAALSHAGVSESSLRKYECELDFDDGYTYYEIEFKSGNYEYEYEIDAYSGDILKHEKDWDD